MNEIRKITIDDKNYPKALKELKDAPKVLFIKGEIKNEELCFAIVGSRRYSSYGKQAALDIAGQLADSGITIVSGLAPGIDTFAHQAAVERKKRTIAVLGTGIDEKSLYPKENIPLSRRIIELGGCLISEYPEGTQATRFTFPQRNRIISGLSKGVLVVEAKEKSGSLITANWALQQKRKLFAVPGPIYSLNSKGPNLLIKRVAKLAENADDILKELGLFDLKSAKENKIKGDSDEENLILNVLEEESLYLDKIIEKTKLNAATAASILTILEMKGAIRNLGGNVYALTR